LSSKRWRNQYNRLTIWNQSNLNSNVLNYRYYSTEVKEIKYRSKYKKEYKLNLVQKEALIGIILGDGFLERNKPTYNTRLRIEQSFPSKKDYLESLYELLRPLTVMKPKILTRTRISSPPLGDNSNRNNKKRGSETTTQSMYFRTLAFPCLNYYYELFYNNNKKVVPNNLDELLTVRGLAYLIMDDGGKSVYNQTIIHTRSFSKKEVIYIQSVLYKNFELRTRIEEKIKNQWIIYIPVRQNIKLKDIVGPYMHESMLYKI